MLFHVQAGKSKTSSKSGCQQGGSNSDWNDNICSQNSLQLTIIITEHPMMYFKWHLTAVNKEIKHIFCLLQTKIHLPLI